MLREGIPLTRAEYFSVSGLDLDPEQVQPEFEGMIPWRFRHPKVQQDEDDEKVIFPPGM